MADTGFIHNDMMIYTYAADKYRAENAQHIACI
jgi:hypothetical protein